MQTPNKPWLRAAILFGLGYAFAGVAFAIPSTHVQFWRLAAWGVSGVLLAMHVAYERFRMESRPLAAASHVGLGAAIGGFGIAVGANVHSLLAATPSKNQPMLLLSLGIWPVVTGLPAFLVALGLSAVLARTRR
jgi:hypothetical protein